MKRQSFQFKQFEERKRQHIEQALHPSNQAAAECHGLAQIKLLHEALPDFAFAEVDLTSHCFGRVTPTPFYISGMTAGHAKAFAINHRLAKACEKRGWVLGVGSQRRDLEQLRAKPSRTGTVKTLDNWARLRREAPELILLANLGITQVIPAQISELEDLIEACWADALVIHLNPLQEVLQPEGTPQFQGALAAIRAVAQQLATPLVVKETGCGFSLSTLRRLQPLRLAAVDMSGLGGTHWGRIEGGRAPQRSLQAAAAQTFANWGISTHDSVQAAVAVFKQQQASDGAHVLPPDAQATAVWASGGVRSGLDAAKLLALGADRVGYAQPALSAALESEQALLHWMALQEFELKVALFCTGSRTLGELRQRHSFLRLLAQAPAASGQPSAAARGLKKITTPPRAHRERAGSKERKKQ